MLGRFPRGACRAPFGSLYFDQFGGVRACCANQGHLMGDANTQSIREIWDSAASQELRDALRRHDYSKGCELCSWQVAHGGQAIMARSFDRLARPGRRLRSWPEEMQFSLSNACNLQCVMCNGDLSSAIRAHRDQLPPLPRVYGESFFEELAGFVPHLERARFFGGEPLLGAESLRVMELIAALNPGVQMDVTTNGTTWSDRQQAIFDACPFGFVLSLDGATRETFESVRVGADFDVVMGNLDRFERLAAEHDTWVGINVCLMVDNWHEFADLLEMAERRGFGCSVSSVIFPLDHSLVQRPLEELQAVVAGLEARESTLRLDRHRSLWDEQIVVLRERLAELERNPDQVITDPWGGQQQVMPGSAASFESAVTVELGRRPGPDATVT